MTKTATRTEPHDELTDARERLAALEDEARTLAERTSAARRAADVEEWMRLEQRGEDLPGLLDRARVRLLDARFEAAWLHAEALAAAEPPLAETAQRTRAALDELARSAAPPPTSNEQVAERELVAARLRDAAAAAAASHLVARHATASALAEVEDLEDAVESATGDRPPAGQELRAAPRVLHANVMLHHPADRDPLEVGGGGGTNAPVRFLAAGTRAPRWAAHLITNERVWRPRRPVGVPTVAEVEESLRRQAELAAAQVGDDLRLAAGGRQHRAIVKQADDDRRRVAAARAGVPRRLDGRAPLGEAVATPQPQPSERTRR